ncbi:MAG: ComF family protein [Clostridia bacterium]|nr:ComF family protein [Clostridia bacterium]
MINVLFPSGYKCVVCGAEIKPNVFSVCDTCFKLLPHIAGKVCLTCGEPLFSDANYCLNCKNTKHSFTKCFAPFTFENQIVKLIHNLKYDGKKYLAKPLSNFMFKCFMEQNLKVDLVVPVPLHTSRQKERGFNQAEELCNAFVSHGFNVNTTCVSRVKQTTTQTNLNKVERKENLLGAFKVNSRLDVKGKVVLIVDDVYTTGATFNELASVLVKAGASKVFGLTCAHTMLNKS